MYNWAANIIPSLHGHYEHGDCSNLVAQGLFGRPCLRLFSSMVSINVVAINFWLYPDVSVTKMIATHSP